jgi:HAE1 family hydrophobic/amphiphilic exporter-1
MASGAGALGNKTIGSAAAGGMLIGTIFGVILIPGLYFVFGNLEAKMKLRNSKEEKPYTETI